MFKTGRRIFMSIETIRNPVVVIDGIELEVLFTYHAQHRQNQRKVSEDEVLASLREEACTELLNQRPSDPPVVVYDHIRQMAYVVNVHYSKYESPMLEIITVWTGTDLLKGQNQKMIIINA
jgi:hypothetical protein